jgi:hypothetical protein
MEKKKLSDLLEGKIFQIPDYQRGYAWEEKQWKDFVQDIDALIDDKIISHYTGTVVVYQPPEKPTEYYGIKKLEIVDIVDGQQRLTTCSLYLSIVLTKLMSLGFEDYKGELTNYLFSGSKSKLRLNNDTADFYFDLITKGVTSVNARTIHQKRLLDGYNYLKKHIDTKLDTRKECPEDYLRNIFDALIRKLNFSYYPIEVESEIGMTFELMNSRGKELSSMELLKNYLMYWVYRNLSEYGEKEDFTKRINKTWKEVYINIAQCNGSASQCLRIAWTLFFNHTPKSWQSYEGFKSKEVFPLRDFDKNDIQKIKDSIIRFVDGISLISKHYAKIISLDEDNNKESLWLSKIKNAGNIANYLPLMTAVRIKYEKSEIEENDYIDFLHAIEKFSYRVFLWEGKRSNAGISSFYRWADDIFSGKHSIQSVTDWISNAIDWYSNENDFRKTLIEFYDWYRYRRLLKYTLFEYELFLLQGKNKPKIQWDELSDSTIEHILPQTPDQNSNWLKKWNDEDIKKYTHDISNLVLTQDNSHYSNFEFERKKKGKNEKGEKISEFFYSNSDIRQERKIAQDFEDWTADSCKTRREELESFIIKKWGIDIFYDKKVDVVEEINEEEDEVVFNDAD